MEELHGFVVDIIFAAIREAAEEGRAPDAWKILLGDFVIIGENLVTPFPGHTYPFWDGVSVPIIA